MAIYRGPGGTGDSTANASGDAAIASTAAANAAASASAAASSAASAGVDAGTAQNAANNAANSQTAAATSAGNAATSASSASTSATAALASQTAAALSAANTATLYDNFDDRYLGVKVTSPATDNDGNTLQTGALYFNSTTNDMFVWTGSLWTTVSNTTTSTNAAASAAAALASQTAAATSATNAATSATSASTSASTATTQASNASSSASAASTSASNAATSASSAASSASTATTQASNAATSATNAANSATSASNSASTATTQAGIATTQATNAAASYDAFDDRYLGAKSSAPTLDNDGNALLTGAIYWNTSGNSLWIWNGSAWDPAAFSAAGSVTSFNTRTGAITLTSGDVTGALTYTPVTDARTLTINGTSYDLTANRSWTIDTLPSQTGNSGKYLKTDGSTTSWDALDISTADISGTLPVAKGGTGTATSFTTGSVVFAGASGVYSQDNANLFWDDSNNYLGIGTATPTTKLTISNNTALPSAGAITGTNLWQVGADATNNVILLDAFVGTPVFVGRRATGTAASPSALGSGGTITGITAHGYGTTGYSSGSRAGLTFLTSQAWTDTAQGTFMAFSTTTNGTTTNTERMRIDNAGNVGIGTSSPANTLDVTGAVNSVQSRFGNVAGRGLEIATTTVTGTNDAASILNAKGGSKGTLIIQTDSSERMRIDSSGNVGIGTSSPSALLQTFNNQASSTTATVQKWSWSDPSASATWGLQVDQIHTGSAIDYAFRIRPNSTTPLTALYMQATTGNVGIGTTSPGGKLGIATGGSTDIVAALGGTFPAYTYRNGAGAWFHAGKHPSSDYFYIGNGATPTTNINMVVDSSGNVGIGTTSPSNFGKFAVVGASSGGQVVGAIVNTSGTANTQAVLSLNTVNDNFNVRDSQIRATNNGSNQTTLEFYTANAATPTEKMRIDSSGNVGIGTTSVLAATKLDVRGAISAYDGGTQEVRLNTEGNIEISRSDGVPFIDFKSSTAEDYDCRIQQVSNGLTFQTGGNGSASERMRITSGGEVYIAGTTDQGAYNLQCNGTGVWGAGAYVNGSDERIKQDITPIDTGLDVVNKLNPVTYKYKEDWSKDQSTQTGFIAQELLVALEGKNYVDGIVQQGGEYMSVAYQNIIPLLTKAIQELSAKVETLEAQLQGK